MKTNRIVMDELSRSIHWSEAIADEVVKNFPNQKNYTCAAGISPSGTVHFGNFRDVITSFAVAVALKEKGLPVKSIFSWDNFDRFRKVPTNVPEKWSEYIGMPLTAVPSPLEGFSSYADCFQQPFAAAMKELGIELEYRNQTEEYKSGKYDALIFEALKKRKEIGEILLSFMTEKGKTETEIVEADFIEKYYPISVYSRFTGKDATEVLSFDGVSTIEYHCKITGKTEAVDLSKERIAKLAWKVDWPMRWEREGVVFEPGGHDHASPGGSYDTASVIAERVFNVLPPVFAEYKFVGIQGFGAKMSGSKGNAISPAELLEIYEPALLKWLYIRKRPDQPFSLAFDSEIYRQYDEFDREAKENPDSVDLKMSNARKYINPIPFKQAVALGQITQWNLEKVIALSKDLNANYDGASIEARLSKAKNWLLKYNENELIVLLDQVNYQYVKTLDEKTVGQIKILKIELEKTQNSVEELEQLVYSIPKDPALTDKENAPAQKEFFKHIYNILINKDQGPRLSTFLWAIDRQKVLDLLSI